VMSTVFVLVHVVGDPAQATLGERARPEQLAAFRARHGLDQPLGERYVQYVGALATLRLGTSYQDGQPVAELLARRLPRTALLGLMALTLELALGLAAGVAAALRRGRWLDRSLMALGSVGMALPSFVIGLWLLGTFAFRLGWFPVGGYGLGLAEHVYHALLPALTLALSGAATYARLVRGEMVEALESDFLRAARATGVSMGRLVLVHAARNALLPVVALLGVSLRGLVSGAVVTETIFGWPGMGRLAVEAISGLDLPVVLGIVFVACVVVQLGTVGCDLALAALDPRLRDR